METIPRRRTLFGTVFTVSWLGIGVMLLYWKLADVDQMRPADWGNFLSGFVAPIAFLWFILSYFQQGDELRLNTEALKLQQEELRSQVKQTRSLVREAERQATEAMEMLVLERQQIEESRAREKTRIQPRFQSVKSVGSAGRCEIGFRSVGGPAHYLAIKETAGLDVHVNPVDVIDRGAVGRLTVGPTMTNFPTRIRIEYVDEQEERHALKGGSIRPAQMPLRGCGYDPALIWNSIWNRML